MLQIPILRTWYDTDLSLSTHVHIYVIMPWSHCANPILDIMPQYAALYHIIRHEPDVMCYHYWNSLTVQLSFCSNISTWNFSECTTLEHPLNNHSNYATPLNIKGFELTVRLYYYSTISTWVVRTHQADERTRREAMAMPCYVMLCHAWLFCETPRYTRLGLYHAVLDRTADMRCSTCVIS